MIVRVAILMAALSLAAEAQYILGPRGGCYTVSASGRKRYVDRSRCAEPVSPARSAAPPADLAPAVSPPASSALSDFDVARKLLDWFKAPAASPGERALKADLAKRLGLTGALPRADRQP